MWQCVAWNGLKGGEGGIEVAKTACKSYMLYQVSLINDLFQLR